MAVPIALIVDDGAPVNLMFWHDTLHHHEMLVPNEVARAFADISERHGIRGKFSVLPMPAGLGRIDVTLNMVSPRHLKEFLRVMRERIAPLFDITCELLTHSLAYDAARDRCLHVCEDEWVARSSVEQIAEYITLAARILERVGLASNGVTSPWATGNRNEKVYAEAIARAMYRVHRRKVSWYFLHCLGQAEPRGPWVAWSDAASGLKAISVPANTDDPFWNTQYGTGRARRQAAVAGVETMLSKDGRTGRLRTLFELGCPLTIVTHWQSLFSSGSMAGLRGLDLLAERINRVFGSKVQWMRCSELAKMALGKGG